MSDKYKNKYRISSARLQNWDYGNNGAYFITICTKNRKHFFGEIVDTVSEPEMQLNEIGKLAEQFWVEIPIRFPFIELGNFVVMPNHVHGILIIDKHDTDTNAVLARLIAPPQIPLQSAQIKTGGCTGEKNPMFHENISRIMRWYKGRSTFEIHKIKSDFAWQPRFHDHIIRDAESFERIQNYIEKNPFNWKGD